MLGSLFSPEWRRENQSWGAFIQQSENNCTVPACIIPCSPQCHNCGSTHLSAVHTNSERGISPVATAEIYYSIKGLNQFLTVRDQNQAYVKKADYPTSACCGVLTLSSAVWWWPLSVTGHWLRWTLNLIQYGKSCVPRIDFLLVPLWQVSCSKV